MLKICINFIYFSCFYKSCYSYGPNVRLIRNADENSNVEVGFINMVKFDNSYLEMEPAEVKLVNDTRECGVACVVTTFNCKSINYYRNTNGNLTCEILDGDKFRNSTFFVERTGTSHFAIQNDCITKKPCLSGLSCFPNYENNTHSCENTGLCRYQKNGIVDIMTSVNTSIRGHCENGSLTILRRTNTSEVDFVSKKWNDYKNGFGNIIGEYWIGNENLHKLTTYYNTTVDFELKLLNKTTYFTKYSNFSIGDESTNFQMSISGFSGPPGAQNGMNLSTMNGMYFSTTDRDNDQTIHLNCALTFGGGWWYNSCFVIKLTGSFCAICEYANGIHWMGISTYYESFFYVRMSIKEQN